MNDFEHAKNDDFTKGYITAALWSSCDSEGEPLDRDLDHRDLSPECAKSMIEDCRKFQEQHESLWEDATTGRGEWNIDEQAGHDFWLTRCGHGVGFWARPEIYGKANAKRLTDASKVFGEVDLYVSNEKIYLYGG